MDFETFLTNISQSLPQFETRVVIFAGLLILLLLINLLFFSKSIRSLNWKIILNIVFIVTLAYILVSTFYTRAIPQETGIIVSTIIVALSITINTVFLIIHKKKYHIFALKMRMPAILMKIGTITFGVIDFAIAFACISLVVITIYARPYAIYSFPEPGSYLQSADQSISIRFSIPVDQNTIGLNISPEVKGKWVFNDSALNTSYRDEVKFIPEESFYPDSKIVIYLTKMTRIAAGGQQHEQSIEMFAPKSPQVSESNPSDGAKNVSPQKDLEISYDAPIGKFVNINYEIIPKIDFTVINISPTKQAIHTTEQLSQDQLYQLKAYRQLRSYNVSDNSDIRLGDTETILDEKFTTVSTPNIESYSPQGDNVNPAGPVIVVFQEEMDPESVKNNLTITPDLPGVISWNDERTFVYTSTEAMPKDTKFTFTFLAGTLNKYSGKTKENIVISFKTAGKVQATAVSPAAGTSGAGVTGVVLSITFNQEVDHESAQLSFVTSPSVPGTFSWNGNTLNYTITSKLAYSTRYDFSVNAGVKAIYGIDSDTPIASFFTTKSNVFILGVPQYYQPVGTFICNTVAARMVLAFKGIYRTDNDVIYGIGMGGNPNGSWVDGYGTHWDPISNYLNSQGLTTEIKHGWNIAEMAQEVEAGHPVILWWWNRYSSQYSFNLGGATAYNGMHSEVVVGFVGDASNPSSIITNDPWRGRLYYSASGFNSTWSYIGNTAVVVK